ncbi:hypothetical protein GCM10009687_01930 [Asanoa iriomotensis]
MGVTEMAHRFGVVTAAAAGRRGGRRVGGGLRVTEMAHRFGVVPAAAAGTPWRTPGGRWVARDRDGARFGWLSGVRPAGGSGHRVGGGCA